MRSDGIGLASTLPALRADGRGDPQGHSGNAELTRSGLPANGRDDANAEGHVARIDQVDSHRVRALGYRRSQRSANGIPVNSVCVNSWSLGRGVPCPARPLTRGTASYSGFRLPTAP